jgi:hypothetical protein
MPLVAHLRGQLRILGSGLADEAGFPDVVGERLLTIDVLAVRQRQVGGKRVRVLRRGHDDGVEIVRFVEDAPEVGELLGLRVALGSGVQRRLVHVAEHDDVLVRMRRGRAGGSTAAPPFRRAGLAARHDGEFAQARAGAAAASDERDVQLVVQILPAQKRRRSGDGPGGQQGPANKLAPRHRKRASLFRGVLHDVLLYGRWLYFGNGTCAGCIR